MVGEDMLTIAAAALFAESQHRIHGDSRVWDLAEEVYRTGRKRIDHTIHELLHNDDHNSTAVGGEALHGHYSFLSRGIIQRGLNDYGTQNQEIPGSPNKCEKVAS